jgi:DNA-binding PadR family transcriptional regulator
MFKALGRFFRGRERRSVDLDPVEQMALAFIASFPETTEHAVFAEVTLKRPAVGWGEMYAALQKLRRNALVTEHSVKEDPAKRYRPTDRGKAIARHIPGEPVSTIAFTL